MECWSGSASAAVLAARIGGNGCGRNATAASHRKSPGPSLAPRPSNELLREALRRLRGVVAPGVAGTAAAPAGTPPGASLLGRFGTLLGLVTIGATRSGPRLLMRDSVFDLLPQADGWFGLRLGSSD